MDFFAKFVEKINQTKNITNFACVIIFVVISFMMGSFYIKNVSPLTLPDANMHLENSVSLAEGNVFLTKDYVKLPSQYSFEYEDKNSVRPLADFAKTNRLISNILPDIYTKGDDHWISKIQKLPKVTGKTKTYIRHQYPSINWLPQALGFSFAQAQRSSVANTFISMRVANLIFYIVTAVISLCLLPRGKIIATALLLNPYTIFLASSISGDIFTIAAANLFIAFLFNLCAQGETLRASKIVPLFFLGILLFLTKVAYVPLLLLIFAIPKQRLKLSLKFLYTALIGAIGSVLYLLWSKFFSVVGYPLEFKPEKNLAYVLERPWKAIVSIFDNVIQPKEVLSYWNKAFSGKVKLVNQQLLYPVIICFILGLIWLMVYLIFLRNKANLRLFIVSVLAAFGSIFITNAALLVTWTFAYKFGFKDIIGFQGRYYIPLILLLLVPWVANYKAKNKPD
ncbi:MAG: DUF2142 domain-containing protein [Streptococcaceae bacterium]|jgi:uncharacterized membrane protein|nr:DUF2142 domain-containing protein [Streptococcaceae bacterium]